MSQSMASYYNPSAAYGSLSAASMAAAAAAAQQSAAAMSAGLTAPAQVSIFKGFLARTVWKVIFLQVKQYFLEFKLLQGLLYKFSLAHKPL